MSLHHTATALCSQLDVSTALPELKRLPGLKRWRIRDRFRWYDTWEEAEPVSRTGHPLACKSLPAWGCPHAATLSPSVLLQTIPPPPKRSYT